MTKPVPITDDKHMANSLNKKRMSMIERRELKRIIDGKLSPDTEKAKKLLERPHMGIAFESLLERYRLSDDYLVKRLAEIVKRKPTESTSLRTGAKSTNITTVDANARDTIRMIWQMQGRFVDKHEFKGELSNVEDKDLDNMINTGMEYILNRKVSLGNDNPTTGTNR